jgi:hypothetical protein
VYRPELPESAHMAIVALYDPTSGDILHWHCYCADDASDVPEPQALETEALDHARRHASDEKRKKLADASSVHFDRQSLKSRGPFRVDTKTRRLVELDR